MSGHITREHRARVIGLTLKLSEQAGQLCAELLPLYDAGVIELGATDIADRIHGLAIQLSDLVGTQLRRGRHGRID